MATFSAARTEVTEHTAAAVADTATDTDDIDLETGGYYEALIFVSVAIASGSPSGDVTIRVYRSGDATSSKLETEPSITTTLNFTATGTKSKTIGGIRAGYVRVEVENQTGEAATWDLLWEGLQQTSA